MQLRFSGKIAAWRARVGIAYHHILSDMPFGMALLFA
jgi:hypothetical protein